MWKPRFIDIDHIPKCGLKSLPNTLAAFIWFFIRQVKWPLILFLVLESITVGLNNITPFFIREFTNILTTMESPDQLWQVALPTVLWFLFLVYFMRNVMGRLNFYLMNACFLGYFREMVRYQLGIYLRGHSLEYFNNDFAGRLASKVAEVARAINILTVQFVRAAWSLFIALITSAILLASAHWIFIAIFAVWIVFYIFFLIYFVPRIRPLAKNVANASSKTQGRLVDSVTNILLVKLFSRKEYEDSYQLDASLEAADTSYKKDVLQSWMWVTLSVLIFLLGVPTTLVAFKGVAEGWLTIGDAMLAFTVIPNVVATSWWVSDVMAMMFDQFGVIEDGMNTIAKPYSLVDKPNAGTLNVPKGGIKFKNVGFHYGKGSGIIDKLSIKIKPGEKVGIVGRSGAGKSTLVNLLLRFYDVESGKIVIDDQNIADYTQDSLRQHIAMVTQDTSLLHRSIIENIRYAKPDATMDEIIAATKKAHAHAFIPDLTDKNGKTGYEALVGERGVKLSGGQRQRIAIARVILKNAPILILDEATSALDSEVEEAIQENLNVLMEDKTVIAIAHRLSTLAIMDRIVVMDKGDIIEDGTHDELIAKGGLYADLWHRQSGGFLAEED